MIYIVYNVLYVWHIHTYKYVYMYYKYAYAVLLKSLWIYQHISSMKTGICLVFWSLSHSGLLGLPLRQTYHLCTITYSHPTLPIRVFGNSITKLFLLINFLIFSPQITSSFSLSQHVIPKWTCYTAGYQQNAPTKQGCQVCTSHT